MHPKLARPVLVVSPGREDVFGILQEISTRKVMRRVAAWMRSPQWIPSSAVLEAYRTSTRGTAQIRLGGLSTTEAANAVCGEMLWR